MALTGLDIFKLLPKTNCGECACLRAWLLR